MPMPQRSGDCAWPSSRQESIHQEVQHEPQKTLEDRGIDEYHGSVMQEGYGESFFSQLPQDPRQPGDGALCSDRAELIERIKRGESPTWVPSQTLRQEYLKENGEPIRYSSPRVSKPHPPLLPPAEIGSSREEENRQAACRLDPPSEIERPRSALHAGDFKDDHRRRSPDAPQPGPAGFCEPDDQHECSVRWYQLSPPLKAHNSGLFSESSATGRHSARDRAPSLNSLSSSSYVLKKPTTPLVQQSNNTDLDFSDRDRSASPGRRRHTLHPDALRALHAKSSEHCTSPPPRHLSLTHRREASFPYAHQVRRSVTSNWVLQPSSPPTPAFLRSRRTSFSSEASSRHRASMVGSYEESILRGRMSTAPSKPFDFHAHIGVLGKGKRPQMPAHVTVPFQAVFYDWSSNNDSNAVHDEPSPYVGNIDLQNANKSQTIPASDQCASADANFSKAMTVHDPGAIQFNGQTKIPDTAHGKRKRTDSAQPPMGSYRIPEQGQLQVVVKNPYKTALKLFLVPYDLVGMDAGQKTFVRQRYYSAGPVIEQPLLSSSASSPALLDAQKKPKLRYLIHLNICCPAKGRYYLYQHIRVVFANRVPDDKERLTKDTQEPDPKYSPWKPLSDSPANQLQESRHSMGISPGRQNTHFSCNEPGSSIRVLQNSSATPFPHGGSNVPPVPPMPFQFPSIGRSATSEWPARREEDIDMDVLRPTTRPYVPSTIGSHDHLEHGQPSSDSGDSDDYAKLKRGEDGYGGLFGRASTPESGEGLLARRLRSQDVQKSLGSMEAGEYEGLKRGR